MVSSESVMLTCVIDATKKRDVPNVDIPNAFIQTVVEDEKDRAFRWLIYWGLLLLMPMDLMRRLGKKVKSNCLSNA
jgi:hypothetical protein